MKTLIYLLLVFFLIACQSEQISSDDTEDISLPNNDADNGAIILPAKFGALVVADTLGRGRHLVIKDNGDVYVHLRALDRNGKSIIVLRDTSGDGRADIQEGFSTVTGTGIEIHNNYLYYSDRTAVYRSPMKGGSLLPDTTKIDTIAHFVDGGGHMEKPFDFDGKGNMYVNIGSQTNACQETPRTKGSPGIDPCVELETRAGIWRFSDDDLHQKQEEALRYATGIRNAVAIKWNNQANSLFVVQHGRDDLHRFWPEHFTEEQNVEMPAEEFFQVGEGDDFGWPYCYFNPFDGKKYLNPEYGGDGKRTDRCEGTKLPLVGFPGHWGPNDLIFYTGDLFPERYRNGAFIAFHGSWNRLNHDQGGYKVVFVPMENGKPSGNWEIFAEGFVGPAPIKSPGDAQYRPCGLAQGPDGSLYIFDSQKGRIWRIFYYKDGLPVEVSQPIAAPVVSNEETPVAPELVAGKLVYDNYCKACHQADGKGAPGMNPPLAGTDYVTGDKDRLIQIVLNGMNEQVEINGEIYQNVMASHAFLSNQQIADVLTFVRKSYGNDASPILKEDVAKLRDIQ